MKDALDRDCTVIQKNIILRTPERM